MSTISFQLGQGHQTWNRPFVDRPLLLQLQKLQLAGVKVPVVNLYGPTIKHRATYVVEDVERDRHSAILRHDSITHYPADAAQTYFLWRVTKVGSTYDFTYHGRDGRHGAVRWTLRGQNWNLKTIRLPQLDASHQPPALAKLTSDSLHIFAIPGEASKATLEIVEVTALYVALFEGQVEQKDGMRMLAHHATMSDIDDLKDRRTSLSTLQHWSMSKLLSTIRPMTHLKVN